MNKLLAILFPLVLTGCGLPPAITIISYAFDGMSLISTGKTVSDHALSIAMEQDCRVWRVVNEQSVCRDFLPGEKNTLIAQAEEWRDGGKIVGQHEPLGGPRGADLIQTISNDPVVVPNYLDGLVSGYDDIIQSKMPGEAFPAAFGIRMDGAFGYAAAKQRSGDKANPKPESSHARVNSGWNRPEESSASIAAARRAAKIAPAANKADDTAVELANPRVLVLGSFGNRANASRAALKWRDRGVSIVPSRVGANKLYRVVTAPLDEKDYASELRRLRSTGIKDAWALRLCGGAEPKSDACVTLRASAAE
jgi:hypothetical protein